MLERAKGIEPSYAAWEAAVLPLNYARTGIRLTQGPLAGKPFARREIRRGACRFEDRYG